MLFSIKNTAFTLIFLSSLAASSPAPAANLIAEADAGTTPLEKRGVWDAILYSGPNCNTGKATKLHGDGGGCHPGGQSINVQLNGGCKWKTFSGPNCAGSTKSLSGGCNKVTFGSFQVSC
ncbi:hypothetical protein CC80DRAFT_545226 [Byssothecium circinans]|uniref:Uncharacterized protein n=1 Tax=Byssothecium circinans TaxID=147558 RepID=A0A6A5U7E5_9PLEO|nr:hypothetical protein CC80DRAFT_545226 [Byssothecium circinans]